MSPEGGGGVLFNVKTEILIIFLPAISEGLTELFYGHTTFHSLRKWKFGMQWK